MKFFRRMKTCQKGQTATEYMLIVGVLVTVIVAAANFFGDEVNAAIRRLTTNVTAGLDGGCQADDPNCTQ